TARSTRSRPTRSSQARPGRAAWPRATIPRMTWSLADVERSIPDAFAQQVRERPGDAAVSGGRFELTYAELDAAASACAYRILDRCDPGPARVALMMND